MRHRARRACTAGRVLAFDKDAKRLARLQANARSAGAAATIQATCADFLSIDPTEPQYVQVRCAAGRQASHGLQPATPELSASCPMHGLHATVLSRKQRSEAARTSCHAHATCHDGPWAV